jgi:hypothetical protein
VVSSWVIKKFILYLFEIPLVDPLTLTIVLYLFKSLHQYHISKLSSTPFLLLSISLFVVYTVNLPVVRPRSCRIIYYFDTLTLGRRHQLFDRVSYNNSSLSKKNIPKPNCMLSSLKGELEKRVMTKNMEEKGV